MLQWTLLYIMLITGTCLLIRFQGTKITGDFPKININFVLCTTFFQTGKQARLFGGDRGREAPLVLSRP
jgi:hypothetical protein